MDKFFYDINPLDNGKFGVWLFVQVDDDLEELNDVGDDVPEFDTFDEAMEHVNNLPDFAYHVEQFGDV